MRFLAVVLVAGSCGGNPIASPAGAGGAGGAGGTPDAAAATGGAGAAGGAGGVAGPVEPCAAGMFVRGQCSGEPAACFNTCGPQKSGIKTCYCTGGAWSCPTCAYDPTHDYSCFLLSQAIGACPFSGEDPTMMGLPQSGDACNLPPCQPCGSSIVNGYRSAAGSPTVGYCVCAPGGFYSCAPIAEWPPQSSGGGEPSCMTGGFKTCGPLKSGTSECSCINGTRFCAACTFNPSNDYSCYKVSATTPVCPFDASDSSMKGLPRNGDPCSLPTCQPCGSSTGYAYRDSTDTPRVGYCVCTDPANGIYSCATPDAWPPQ